MSHLTDTSTFSSPPSDPACCRFSRFTTPLLVAVMIVSLSAAAFFAGRSSGLEKQPTVGGVALPMIDATAAVHSEKFSMATGIVSDEADGLLVLDHNSGLLQCTVIYPRLGQFMARFTVNVGDALGTGGKGGDYLMLTGRAQFRSASNRPAAETVVYVMDSATGNYACYGIPFNRVAMNANKQQQGALVLISTGAANPVIDRDNLR